jgi:hypothetical protein
MSSIEILVGFVLLAGVLTISTSLVVRLGRLQQSQRDYRLALDELSNQLDRLAALPAPQRAEELKELKPSPFAAERLVGCQLSGQIDEAQGGERITLRITWDEPQRASAPVSMAAWSFPTMDAAAGRQP